MYYHYMTYMGTPYHKNPFPWIMEFTIWIDPSLVFITIYLVHIVIHVDISIIIR